MRMIIRPGFRANLACFVLLLLLCDKLVCGSTDYDPDHGKSDFTSFEDQWHDAARNRDVPVKIYYPKSATGKLPIIIFSHGLGGSREGYSYLGQYWASHGYVSVHLTHHGSDTDAIRAGGAANLKQTGQALANGVNAVDRAKDVNFAIDELTKLNADGKSPLKDRLDLSSIGMAGHSFGAGTTLMISGESTRNSKSFSDRRVKCAIALCPPVTVPKAMYETAYAGIKIPLFIMTGTKDDSPIGETKAADRRVPFDHLQNIPAFLLTLKDADHMLFGGNRPLHKQPFDEHYHQLILQGSVAFWDGYLRGNEAAKEWLKLRYAKDVGDDGVFEQK